MTSYFTCMCEVDSASPMIATLDLQTLLNTLIREDLSDDETPDWTAAQDMLFLGGMYEEAHKKTEQVAGVEPDTIRSSPFPTRKRASSILPQSRRRLTADALFSPEAPTSCSRSPSATTTSSCSDVRRFS